MAEKVIIDGNEAVARGAIHAGCKHFFGYPITPQSEIAEYMARQLPRIGGVFVQSECEGGSIYMLYGGALAGARVMTSTSSPGFSLMQEGISYISAAEAPCVIVNVMRMGPGIGTGGQQGQTDYRQVTKGGGHGAYRCIVLAPSSPQEIFDLVQLAFYLSDKYRIVALILSDFIIGRMAEPVELRTLEFGPLPEKEWALKGKGEKGGRCDHPAGAPRFPADRSKGLIDFYMHLLEKYQKIAESEVRYDTYLADDATLLVAAYGSSARMARGAVNMARAKGIKAGLFRPITLWPFPEESLRRAALATEKVLVVEDSPGEFVEDVRFVVQGQVPVHLLGLWARHNQRGGGIIHPERILEEMEKLT